MNPTSMTKTLKQLIDALPFPYQVVGPDPAGIEITGVADDNRQVLPGYLFVAYPGVAVDGHRFIPDALARGAAAVVCEKPQTDQPATQVVVPNGRQSFAHLC